jgi:hypothetical protein
MSATCAPRTPPSGAFEALDVATEAGGGEPDAHGDPGRLSPDGTWLLFTETFACVKALGSEIEGITWRFSLARMVDLGGGRVTVIIRPCQTIQAPLFGLSTVTPDAVEDGLPERYVSAFFGPTTAVASLETGSTFESVPDAELWGVHLSDPLTDELPGDPEDPRVYDVDGDGHPGATLVVESATGEVLCDRWLVHRAVSSWRGLQVSSTRVEGGGSYVGTESLFHASTSLCGSDSAVRFVDGLHRFVLLRVDGLSGAVDLDADGDGLVDCREVRASDPSVLFSMREPDDARCK